MADSSKAKDSPTAGKKAPISSDDQFKFLISCIRYSNNGKVDFGEVARECSIVSKGAAAKRYERMMKAHGIHQTQASIRDTNIQPRPKASPPSKKRKIDDINNGDDEESQSNAKPEPAATPTKGKRGAPKFKGEAAVAVVKDEPAATTVKDEPDTTDQLSAVDLADERGVMGLQTDGANDGVVFNDFLNAGALEQRDEHTTLKRVWSTTVH